MNTPYSIHTCIPVQWGSQEGVSDHSLEEVDFKTSRLRYVSITKPMITTIPDACFVYYKAQATDPSICHAHLHAPGQAWPQHDLVPKVLFEFYLFHMIEIQGIHKRGGLKWNFLWTPCRKSHWITLVQKVQKKWKTGKIEELGNGIQLKKLMIPAKF